jgi:hypothetical protein
MNDKISIAKHDINTANKRLVAPSLQYQSHKANHSDGTRTYLLICVELRGGVGLVEPLQQVVVAEKDVSLEHRLEEAVYPRSCDGIHQASA